MALSSTRNRPTPFERLVQDFEKSGHGALLAVLPEQSELHCRYEPHSMFSDGKSAVAPFKLRIGRFNNHSWVHVFSNGRVELDPPDVTAAERPEAWDSSLENTCAFSDLGPFDYYDPSFCYLPIVQFYFHRWKSIARAAWTSDIGPLPKYSELRAALRQLCNGHPTYGEFRKETAGKKRTETTVSVAIPIPDNQNVATNPSGSTRNSLVQSPAPCPNGSFGNIAKEKTTADDTAKPNLHPQSRSSHESGVTMSIPRPPNVPRNDAAKATNTLSNELSPQENHCPVLPISIISADQRIPTGSGPLHVRSDSSNVLDDNVFFQFGPHLSTLPAVAKTSVAPRSTDPQHDDNVVVVDDIVDDEEVDGVDKVVGANNTVGVDDVDDVDEVEEVDQCRIEPSMNNTNGNPPLVTPTIVTLKTVEPQLDPQEHEVLQDTEQEPGEFEGEELAEGIVENSIELRSDYTQQFQASPLTSTPVQHLEEVEYPEESRVQFLETDTCETLLRLRNSMDSTLLAQLPDLRGICFDNGDLYIGTIIYRRAIDTVNYRHAPIGYFEEAAPIYAYLTNNPIGNDILLPHVRYECRPDSQVPYPVTYAQDLAIGKLELQYPFRMSSSESELLVLVSYYFLVATEAGLVAGRSLTYSLNWRIWGNDPFWDRLREICGRVGVHSSAKNCLHDQNEPETGIELPSTPQIRVISRPADLLPGPTQHLSSVPSEDPTPRLSLQSSDLEFVTPRTSPPKYVPHFPNTKSAAQTPSRPVKRMPDGPPTTQPAARVTQHIEENNPHGRQLEDGNFLICSHCSERTSPGPDWRCSPDGLALCNKCYVYHQMHGVARPLIQRKNISAMRTSHPKRLANGGTKTAQDQSHLSARGPQGTQSDSSKMTENPSRLQNIGVQNSFRTNTGFSFDPKPPRQSALSVTEHRNMAGIPIKSLTQPESPRKKRRKAELSVLKQPASQLGPFIGTIQVPHYRRPLPRPAPPFSYEGPITDTQPLEVTNSAGGYPDKLVDLESLIDSVTISPAVRTSFPQRRVDVDMRKKEDTSKSDSQATITAPPSPAFTAARPYARKDPDVSMTDADEPPQAIPAQPTFTTESLYPSESSFGSSVEIPARKPELTNLGNTKHTSKGEHNPPLNQSAALYANAAPRTQAKAKPASKRQQLLQAHEEKRQRGMMEVQDAWGVRREMHVLGKEKQDCKNQMADAFPHFNGELAKERLEKVTWLQGRTEDIDERLSGLEALVRQRGRDDAGNEGRATRSDADDELAEVVSVGDDSDMDVDGEHDADRA
ncbi:hypothetical protein K491DRAFT_742182 [Lophiostoma macrostomum CBS 122681]|uniref:GATA-type domain-containing protein n=1 Tax=Lophiostoma macrostomum CBS 122681 TaxID=1314788 RepID=A0A6A6SHW3_9PLEO|nr:hypothetical protein K491DRAFT_742182 [Lophiostoma macrostomum CBS 122681]